MIRAREPIEARKPAQAGSHFAEAPVRGIDGYRLGTTVLDDDIGVIVEIGADRGQVRAHFDPHGRKLRRVAEARQLQQLGRVDRARRHDDLRVRQRAHEEGSHRVHTPTARWRSKMSRCASAPVAMVRLGAGMPERGRFTRHAGATPWRVVVRSIRPNPSCRSPFTSGEEP